MGLFTAFSERSPGVYPMPGPVPVAGDTERNTIPEVFEAKRQEGVNSSVPQAPLLMSFLGLTASTFISPSGAQLSNQSAPGPRLPTA